MKLNEFVDRLYGMGDMEAPKTIKPKRTLNGSCGAKDEDDLDESYHNDDFRNLCREYSSLYPYDISLREVWDEIVRNYEDEDLANDVVDYLEGAFDDEEEYDDEFFESLNESFVRQWFPKNEDYFLNDLENVLNIVPVDSRHDEIEDEDQVLYEFSGTKDDFQYAVDNFGYFENLDYQKKHLDDELEYSDDISKLTYNESLNEARNPENDEVNAVLRKWANSNRNKISKRDQKVLDDAGISLETAEYDAPHKYAVHKNHKDDRVPHAFYKDDIKRAHPDHDLANDLATTGRHWSNRDRYNKNKDPRFPWRNAEYRSETPEESDALRPYSDEYKKLKRDVESSKGYPNWHAAAEKELDDFRADMKTKKNESLNLNESKEGLKDWFWSMIENNELDTETATGILLTYISDEDLLDAIEETKEYLES